MEDIASVSFLQETTFCDFNHPIIKKVAQEYKEKLSNENDLSRALFYFVRDTIHYRVGNWNKKASETLLTKSGTCTNKANLLVALCRACGIPAGYGVMSVSGSYYFGPIALKSLTSRVSKKSKHIYAFIYLKKQWVHCDPSDDEKLSLNTQHLNPQSRLVDWDGTNHARLNLDDQHIFSNEGPSANIDHIISKKQRRKLFFPVRLGNKYIHFLRQHGLTIKKIEDLENDFTKWLKKHHALDYLFHAIFIKERVREK